MEAAVECHLTVNKGSAIICSCNPVPDRGPSLGIGRGLVGAVFGAGAAVAIRMEGRLAHSNYPLGNPSELRICRDS